jgi:excisionase family DNA binding protein
MNKGDGERLLTVPEMAMRLGVGTTTAWSLIRSKSVPAIRIKTAVRVSPEAIERFKRNHPY